MLAALNHYDRRVIGRRAGADMQSPIFNDRCKNRLRRAAVDFAQDLADALESVRFAGGVGSLEEAVDYALRFNPKRDPQLLRNSLQRSLRQCLDGRWTWKHDRVRDALRTTSAHSVLGECTMTLASSESKAALVL